MKFHIVLFYISCLLGLGNQQFDTCFANNYIYLRNQLPELIFKQDHCKVDSGFNLFWTEFREAMINFDTIRLMEFTNIPLLAHGFLEEFPKLEVDENNLYHVMNSFLEEEIDCQYITYDENGHPSSPAFIKNIDHIKMFLSTEDNLRCCVIQKSWARVGFMEFILIEDKWKLWKIYTNTFQLQNLFE